MAKIEERTEDLKPGPIWGGWFFWEPPPGKTKETPEDTPGSKNDD